MIKKLIVSLGCLILVGLLVSLFFGSQIEGMYKFVTTCYSYFDAEMQTVINDMVIFGASIALIFAAVMAFIGKMIKGIIPLGYFLISTAMICFSSVFLKVPGGSLVMVVLLASFGISSVISFLLFYLIFRTIPKHKHQLFYPA